MRLRPLYKVTLLETARHVGARQALEKLLLRLLRVRPVLLMTLSIDGENPPFSGPGYDTSNIRSVGADDEALFAAAGFGGMLQGKLAQGPGWIAVGESGLQAWYFLAREESRIANWLIARVAGRSMIWAAGIWVHRDSRGSDLAKRIRAPVLRWSRVQGYREIVTWVDQTNHSSRRAMQKAGYREIGRVVFLRLFGFALVHYGRRWRLGRWSAAQPLVIDLDELREDASMDVALGAVTARKAPLLIKR